MIIYFHTLFLFWLSSKPYVYCYKYYLIVIIKRKEKGTKKGTLTYLSQGDIDELYISIIFHYTNKEIKF